MFLPRKTLDIRYMKLKLAQKYNLPVPRYTSFPAVPYWTGAPSEKEWIDQIKFNYSQEAGVELYLHIPFCEKLCYYCGCHRTITKNKSLGVIYSEYLLKEWELYLKKTELPLKISSIHLGGGTPNFLTPETLEYLFKHLSQYFSEENLQASIEIDPRTCTLNHLQVLKKYGFNRLSMGIQDFDPLVQKTIGREQSFEQVSMVCLQARSLGFEEINFDLIYGLPHQTKQTIAQTIRKVLFLRPTQIAFYSYAHLPDRLKNQKLIPTDALPLGAEKRSLYEFGKDLLEQAKFHEIGLDHFAVEGSILSNAKKQGQLRRNFMGHTLKVSPIIIALGASAISSSSKSFIQNEKEIKPYYAAIEQSLLPISHGHKHSKLDIQIEELMQNFFAQECLPSNQWQGLPQLALIQSKLEELAADNLILLTQDSLTVTELGRPFMRIIASVFDNYYQAREHVKVGSQAL